MSPERRIESRPSALPAPATPHLLSRLSRSWNVRLAALLIALGPAPADFSPASEPGHAPIPSVGTAPAKPEHQPIADGHAEHAHQPEAITTFTREQLQEVLAARVDLKTLKEILDLYRCQCVDGRGDEAVAGVPGGDQGIIVAGLAAYEKLTSTRLSDADVSALLAQYPLLSSHTDDHGTHALHGKLVKHPTLKSILERKSIEQLLEEGTGDAALDEQFLEELSDPDAIGCGHMKNMIKDGPAYGTRGALATAVWKETLRKKWHDKQSKVRHTVLKGGHAERAVTMAQTADGLRPDARVPTLLPNAEKGGQMFVSHADVAEYCLEKELVDRVLTLAKSRGYPVPTRDALLATAKEMLGKQTLETVGRLAKGRPVFVVRFNADGTFTIESKGTVPGK